MERSDHSPERRGVANAVSRLRNTLRIVGYDYVDARIALQEFVESDFEVDEAYSDLYLARLEASCVIPDARTYEASEVAALDMHRFAMYDYWIPLYRATHTADEFREWLPTALDVVFPAEGPHSVAQCGLLTPRAEHVSVVEQACDISPCCVVKRAVHDVRLGIPFIHDDAFDDEHINELERAAYDVDRIRRDANTLCAGLYDKRIITAAQMRDSKSKYDIALASLQA